MKVFPVVSPILFLLVTLVLGFVTPGYNHLGHTISRLAIEKYGWIQILNFLQFAAGLYLTGDLIAKTMQKPQSNLIVRRTFRFCALLLVFAATTRTDPVETAQQVAFMSPMGRIHLGIVLLFLGVSPFGIQRMAKTLQQEPFYRNYASLTLFMGIVALFASAMWFILFGLGIAPQYRGLFQKSIAAWVVAWLVIITSAATAFADEKTRLTTTA